MRLIPKVLNPKQVPEYKPIALCSTHYKIIAKILTKRLQPLLRALISDKQSAFVPERAISDNVLITHEILHYLKTSGARKRCSMAVKTDMSKAYDRIEWDFLREVLTRFGFHAIWITWIMECVTTVSYSFLINGAAQGWVTPSRGLRQGDPLSPYLFILFTEVFSGLCRNAQEKGELIGVKVAQNCPAINHLLFTDDTMFFLRSNPSSRTTFLKILRLYEEALGQCINRGKSSVTFSSKTPPEVKDRVKACLRIEKEGGTRKYLRLPEHFGRRKRDIFTSIVDRIRQKAHSWYSRYLSGAGKLILLKSVLAALPTYAMYCFKLLISLYKQIQSALTRFWWDLSPEVRKMASWKRLTLPKSCGGLGFREIEQFNDALLAKITWRILSNPESLLAQTLLGKYCLHDLLMMVNASSSCSHGWRGVLVGREVLRKGMSWIVGIGSSINVWTDPWLSLDRPLSPNGPPTSANIALLVADLIHPVTGEWNLAAIRSHLPHYEDLIKKIVLSSCGMSDSLVWLPEKSGTYSTKTGYALTKLNVDAGMLDDFDWKKCVWQVKTSPKIQHFLWKTKNRTLPVGSVLQERGMGVDPNCKRCGALETPLHVLLMCPYATSVWEETSGIYKPDSTTVTSIPLLVQTCRRMITLPPTGLGDVPLYPWTLRNLWTNRNKLLFEDKNFSVEETILKSVQDARKWKEAQDSLPKKTLSQSVVLSPTPTLNQAIKIYTDAAWSHTSH